MAALALAPLGAHADDRPLMIPARDVDVTYRMVQPIEGGPALMQRMRWSVGLGRLRVDPPSPSLYMIVDYRSRRLAVVHPADRKVLDMTAAGPGLPVSGPPVSGLPASSLPGSAAGGFTKLDTGQAAGTRCTNWQTRDTAGRAVIVCVTSDGVMLRASQGDNVLLEAASVSYAVQDAAAFAPPDGYRHIDQRAP